jgi:hypothetical protein
VENCLTSNPVLNKLAARGQKDVHALIHAAQTGEREGMELEGNYSAEEVSEYLSVLQKLFRVRDVILRVNLAYIRSAAQEDAYRTEPPFKLQGSYRNMNKIAEKVLPIMNEAELEDLIQTHYQNEAQTLTTGAEANLLKFKELIGTLNDEAEQARWADIKRGFARKQRLHGVDTSDRAGQVVAQLSAFGDGLDAIKTSIEQAVQLRLKAHHAEQQREATAVTQTQTALAPESLQSLAEVFKPLFTNLEQFAAGVAKSASAEGKPTSETKGLPEYRYLLKLLRNQFDVMQHWLKPTYESSREQDKTIQAMTSAVNNLMETHGSLLNYLQQFRDRKEKA